MLTGLAEDLASHGYVVAGIDHTYESRATAFPDGRVATGLALQSPRRDRPERVTVGRAADVSFVLNELTGPHPTPPSALIDPSRIAMAGHSIGGASAVAALLADSRLQAGLDLDGTTHTLIPDPGLSRPFLFLGKASNYTLQSGGTVPPPERPQLPLSRDQAAALRQWKLTRAGAASWERDWKAMTGWKRWLVVAGAVHASFTDLSLLADQLGVDTGTTLPGARCLSITRTYVRAFFDQHLRGLPQALLDHPSPSYPEVTFCSPAA